MTNRELQDRLKMAADGFDVTIVTGDGEGFNVNRVLVFPDEKQLWIMMDDSWLSESDDEDDGDERGSDSDGPVYEREGDMCALPEVSGDTPKCTNPYCRQGQTDAGPCMLCNYKGNKEKKETSSVQDACRVRGRVKVSGA